MIIEVVSGVVCSHASLMDSVPDDELESIVRAALAEDIGAGDATTIATVPEDAFAVAEIVAREPLVVAGLAVAEEAFRQVSEAVRRERTIADGEAAAAGRTLMRVEGPARALLTGERVALNFLQHLSGIATLTRAFVERIGDLPTRVLDTRKTTPGLRRLEKRAVAWGGGVNHRFGLFDQILIKDNHLFALREERPNAIAAAVRAARTKYPNLKVEVEADSIDQVRQALDAGADSILLDNMPLEALREAVALNRGKARLEASGGVRLESVRAIAETGVDCVSVGALTHSARNVDIALDFLPPVLAARDPAAGRVE